MKTCRNVFSELGVDADNYLILHMATTGVKSPIGVIEITGRFGERGPDFQYFLSPEDMILESDLNYAYTRIKRSKYDEEVMETSAFLEEFMGYFREAPPSIIVVNNESWLRRVAKENPNRMLSPLFSAIGRRPVFSLSYYETARMGADYTLFDGTYEFTHNMLEHIQLMKKQAGKGYVCNVDGSYEERGGPDTSDADEVSGLTASQVESKKMKFIWEDMMNNNEARERYAFS